MKLIKTARRRGTILIVVLALLALFAVVGLSFVLYAGTEATAAREYRESMDINSSATIPDAEPVAIRSLGDLIYGVLDNQSGMYSNVRGHELARSKYGWYYTGTAANPVATDTNNTTPFNGPGLFLRNGNVVAGLNFDRFINYSWFPGTNVFLTPERPQANRANPNAAINGNYISKAANYTYPDVNNLYLGLVNPVNGQVLTPSFHRSWVFGSLDPTNPNWTNNAGRFMSMRPRPGDQGNGNQFPFVPPNADGTYTGDVQNLPGSVYPHAASPNILISKNDSVWVDMGLPVQTWNGKRIKPLVAMLILPLNNRVNLAAHGNTRGTANTHDSSMGFGPWEVNPSVVLNTANSQSLLEYQRLIFDRYGSAQTTATAANLPAPIGTLLPPAVGTTAIVRNFGRSTSHDYAPVDWDGGAPLGSIRVQLPGMGVLPNTATTPRWNDPTNPLLARYGNGDPTSTGDGERDRHPSLFNPYFVPTTFSNAGHIPAPSEMFATNQKFGDDLGTSTRSTIGANAPLSLGTLSSQGTFAYNPSLNPANASRFNTTTISNDWAAPSLMPQLQSYAGYQWNPMSPTPNRVPFNYPLPGALNSQDFHANNRWSGASNSLPAVDLNRPLAEYRKNTNLHLSPDNTYNPGLGAETALFYQAWSDRQALARDIFARLVVATGASATYVPATGYCVPLASAPPGSPEYDALRYLAQLSVNIVDQIDNDDIKTLFVWNPINPSLPLDAANFAPAAFAARVVVGYEKAKLAPNEVYTELTNDPADQVGNRSNRPFQLRVWAELVNPSTAEAVPGKAIGAKPLPAIDNNAHLFYQAGVDPGVTQDISPYQLMFVLNGNQLRTDLGARSNVTGMPTAGTNPVIKYTFSTSNPAQRILAPNQGAYGDPSAPNLSPGFLVVGPDLSSGTSSVEFNPGTMIGAGAAVLTAPVDPAMPPPGTPANQMHFTTSNDTEANLMTNLQNLNQGRPALVLRRLANPYAPANDPTDPAATFNPALPPNPYVTIDHFAPEVNNAVPFVNDAVRVASDSNLPGKDRPNKTAANVPPAPTSRFSQGRRELLVANPKLIVRQNPNPVSASAPQQTFFRHNGTTAGSAVVGDATLNLPFDWIVHFDRPLVNQLEATFASPYAPHEVTERFIDVNGVKQAHLAAWTPALSTNPNGNLKALEANALGLYRALDMLMVKPYTYGIPHMGRVPGRININLVVDPRVLLALADPQSGNYYTNTDIYNPTNWYDANTVFGRVMEARRGTTPVGQAIVSQIDPSNLGTPVNVQVPGPLDTPFRSFGTSSALNTANFPTALGVNTTPARNITIGAVTTGVFETNNVAAPNHPFFKQELLRKIQNNITTTTDTFEVYMTVGYFEVTSAPPYGLTNRPALGKEVFKEMPGDMRQKYFAIIDRSQLALDPLNLRQQGQKLFVTELAAAASNDPLSASYNNITVRATGGSAGLLTLAYENQTFTLSTVHAPGSNTYSYIRLGSGANAEWVRITAVGAYNATTGTGILTVTRNTPPAVGLTSSVQFHNEGTAVMNMIPGNPGPQAAFNPRAANYTGVVPFFTKSENP